MPCRQHQRPSMQSGNYSPSAPRTRVSAATSARMHAGRLLGGGGGGVTPAGNIRGKTCRAPCAGGLWAAVLTCQQSRTVLCCPAPCVAVVAVLHCAALRYMTSLLPLLCCHLLALNIVCFSNLACTMLHTVLYCVLCPVLSRPLDDRVMAAATVLSHTAQHCPTLRYALRSYMFCPARWFVLTKMTGLMAEAPSGTHDISLTSSFCMVGKCCSSSTVLQSFSLIGAAALGPAPVAPP
jgi:hypothetical protein